ncbi:hypothetical protein [Halalkalicoccus jeotgali]|nr:hypothetical protein [Halalkalicoccus jeotgali]
MHRTSRTNENFTEDGLETITGQSPSHWGVYCLKELIDNSLEASDGVSITVEVETEENSHRNPYVTEIGVYDDGPGIDEGTIHDIFGDIDYFVGSKRHYALPTRGNQGNALMSILGIQHVINGDKPLVIHSQKQRYTIDTRKEFGQYHVEITKDGPSDVSGFGVTVEFGNSSSYDGLEIVNNHPIRRDKVRKAFRRLVLLNPQCDFELIIDGESETYPAIPSPTVTSATQKELATWFSFNGFIERYQADRDVDPDMTLRDFVSQFHGLKTKADEIVEDIDNSEITEDVLKRVYEDACELTTERSESGLDETIGSIGTDLETRLHAYVGDGPETIVEQIDREGYDDIDDITVYYQAGGSYDEGNKTVPFCFELAAVPTWITGKNERAGSKHILGINQSVLYDGGFVHLHSPLSEGASSFDTSFNGNHQYVVVANIYCPNVGFRDKGKQGFNSEPFERVISEVVGKAKRKIERDIRPRLNDLREEEQEETLSGKAPNGFIKDFVWDNFWDVYNDATDNGTYSIEMRQLYYKFRPLFLDEAEKRGYQYSTKATVDDPKPLELNFDTFSDYISEFEEEELGERLIIRDERGFFVEPHTNQRINLGTTAVRQYDPSDVDYGDILFIEKTGFMDILHREFELTKKYDIGLINSKGWNTTAGQKLVEKIQTANPDATLYVLSDLDIAGVGIADNVSSPDELSDLDELATEKIGVTCDDVHEYGLPAEKGEYKDKTLSQLETMHDDGIVDDETYEYLGEDNRVEINAFSPVELKEYLETKFEDHDITKQYPSPSVINEPDLPDSTETRSTAIEQALGRWVMAQIPDDMVERIEDSVTVDDALTGQLEDLETDPKSLTEEIHEELADNPPRHWSDMNEELVEKREKEAEEASEDYIETVSESTKEYLDENHTVEFE